MDSRILASSFGRFILSYHFIGLCQFLILENIPLFRILSSLTLIIGCRIHLHNWSLFKFQLFFFFFKWGRLIFQKTQQSSYLINCIQHQVLVTRTMIYFEERLPHYFSYCKYYSLFLHLMVGTMAYIFDARATLLCYFPSVILSNSKYLEYAELEQLITDEYMKISLAVETLLCYV